MNDLERQMPAVGIRHYCDYCVEPATLAKMILAVSVELKRFHSYWKHLAAVEIWVVGKNRAHLYVAFSPYAPRALREADAFDGLRRVQGRDRYWTFDQVRFRRPVWARRILKVLRGESNQRAEAKKVAEAVARFCADPASRQSSVTRLNQQWAGCLSDGSQLQLRRLATKQTR